MAVEIKQFRQLTQPKELPSNMTLEYYAPHNLQDGFKRVNDYNSRKERVEGLRRSFHVTASPLEMWDIIRAGVLAERSMTELEALANHHGYTIPEFAKQIQKPTTPNPQAA